MRLDHFISKALTLSERSARLEIAEGRVKVDGLVTKNHLQRVSKFSSVETKDRNLRTGIEPLYLMFHKPCGVLSATSDDHHQTVLDCLDWPGKETLYLAGRLDRSSSGLVLLTNDGDWSESLTDPDQKVSKHYLVTTDRDIPQDAVDRFTEGFDFQPEGIRTRPARLVIHEPRLASVTLEEGRYHQIKRMFHRIDGIRQTSLHRDRIGGNTLPSDLAAGKYRHLTEEEVRSHRVQS